MSEAPAPLPASVPPPPMTARRWVVPGVLFALTLASTTWVGAEMAGEGQPRGLVEGLAFSLPLMTILLAHELGHFVAGRLHRIDISPPYFIPMPYFLLGTMGAVIRMRGAIRRRNALLDVGAAGPLAGLCVALPVLIYGLATSPIEALPPAGEGYFIEGRSLLYLGLLHVLKGPIPEGQDIFLNRAAFAGWAGLLVTMINLVPVGQLDGGHVAYALLGPRQNRFSELIRKAMPLLGLVVGALYGVPAFLAGKRGEPLAYEALAGAQWIVWAGVLWLMTRLAGREHPPTGDEPLSPARRVVAVVTLVLFVLLFMPSWVRQQ